MENQNTIYLYNDEIDIKSYVRLILNQWAWIVLVAFVAGGLTFAYISMQTDVYTSTALVSVSTPSLDVVFDSNIQTTDGADGIVVSTDLTTLALSDTVLVNLYNQVHSNLPEGIQNHNQLKTRLTASTETRSDLIELSGTFNDPELSVIVVNEWSKLFLKSANLFFEGPRGESQTFLKEQLTNTKIEQDQINAELIEFQSRNTITLIQTQLNSDKSLQKSYIDKRGALELLAYNIQGIKTQIELNPNDPNVLSDLTLYALQNRAFGSSGNIQVDVTNFDNLSSSSLESRVSLLNSLELTIFAQQNEIEGLIAQLEPTILFQQEQIQKLHIEEAELESRRAIVENSYESLALKIAEAEIEENDTSGRVQIASLAIMPVEPQPRNRLSSSVVAAVVMTMLSTGIILIHAWWTADEAGENIHISMESAEAKVNFSNGNASDYSVRPIHGNGNGNGIHPTEKEEFPAND